MNFSTISRVEGQAITFHKIFEQGLRRSNERSGYTLELASSYLNQPFSPPPCFNVDALLDIAKARQNLQGDHLWLLQTEPIYTRRYINLEMSSNLGDNVETYHKYQLAVAAFIQDSITFWSWGLIVEEVTKLKELQTSQASSVATKPLWKIYDERLGALEAFLLNQLQRRLRNLRFTLPLRLRDTYKITTFQRLQTASYKSTRRDSNDNPNFTKDRLEFCLSLLTFHDPLFEDQDNAERKPRYEYAMLFAMLDEHLAKCAQNKNMKELNRMDEIIYALLSDMAAVNQMLEMVRFHRPRGGKRQIDQVTKVENGRGWRYMKKHLQEQYQVRHIKKNTQESEIIPSREDGYQKIEAEKLLGRCFREFIETSNPSGTRLSQQWLDTDEKQRKALSQLWA